MVANPRSIGLFRSKIAFEFMVFLEFAGFDIDQDHLAWGQTFFPQDLFRGNFQDTGFRGINNLVVAGDPVAGRA